MALVNLDNSKDLVKNTYFALNLLTLGALASGFLIWFFVPFLTENSKDPKHNIVRVLSLFYVTGAGGIGLFGASRLGRLDRYAKALDKAEDNNFINSIASSQYANQKILEGESELAIAINLSKGPQPEILEGELENDEDFPREINGVLMQDYHWEALELAKSKGQLSARDFQRSAIARRLEIKSEDAKEILKELAKAELGKLEEEGESIKFLPVT